MLRWLTIVLLGLLASQPIALVLPTFVYVLMHTGQIERMEIDTQTLTRITPENLFILDFGVDSLGERLAFRTEAGLYTLNLDDGTTRLIESTTASVPPYRGRGATIAWSPAGDAIAYTTLNGARVYMETAALPTLVDLREGVFLNLAWSPGGRFLAGEVENDIWWIYRRVDNNLLLASVIPSSAGTVWLNDSEIVFAPATGGLRLMSLDQANAQSVLLDESVQYRLPYLTFDNHLVFFGRSANDPALPDGFGRLLGLARGATAVESLGDVPIALSNVRWVPGGSLLLAFQGGALALLDPTSGEVFTLPFSGVAAYDWSPVEVQSISPTSVPTLEASASPAPPGTPTLDLLPTSTMMSAPTLLPSQSVNGIALDSEAFFLADSFGVTQVWWLPSNGLPAARFTGALSDVTEYAVAPGGRRVAYVSDGELWLQRFEIPQPMFLATLDTFMPVQLDFSPDGTQLAYALENTRSGGIWLVSADDGAQERVLPNVTTGSEARLYQRPQFSPDGTQLLVDVLVGLDLEAPIVNAVLELDTRTVVETLPTNDLSALNARWLSDGRFVIYRDANTPSELAPGLYIYNAAAPDTSPRQFLPLPSGVVVQAVQELATGQLRLLAVDPATGNLRAVDMALGQQDAVRDLETLQDARLSPDGQFVTGYEMLTSVGGIAQGALTLVHLETGDHYRLTTPEAVWDFQWG